jgi:2-hydroxychromene-2-carboxylate isomerase
MPSDDLTLVDSPTADLHFWFDPLCPFAWMTSKWVRSVARQRDYAVEWRFVSLRLLNAHVDYDAHFPPEYEAGHTAGLQLLRVAARTRAEHGPGAVGRLYEALGAEVWEGPPDRDVAGSLAQVLATALDAVALPHTLAAALDEEHWDTQIQAETDEALRLAGKDVGTPILQFEPPDGVAFFGPVISRLPDDEDAVALWDHVIGLARFPGFSELKRSLREQPQLPAFGVAPGEVGRQEDWHGGSRRQKR